MPSLNDIYRKFGETAEAAQLLETEIGNLLLYKHAYNDDFFEKSDIELSDILRIVNRSTLGRLIKDLNRTELSTDEIVELLSSALESRNRLSHSFFRQHNFRRNSEEGRAFMMKELEEIHETLLEAYKATLRLSDIDLDSLDTIGTSNLPTNHLPI